MPRCTCWWSTTDRPTRRRPRPGTAGAQVVSNPFNLGVGGPCGWASGWPNPHGYDVLVQVDADGQHDARDIPLLVAGVRRRTRAPGGDRRPLRRAGDISVPRARRAAMRLLARYLSRVTRTKLTDVTSGFRAHNRAGIELFARNYPADYLSDTVESLIIVADAGGRVHQVPVTMRPRLAGTPSQSAVAGLPVPGPGADWCWRCRSSAATPTRPAPFGYEPRRTCDRSPHHRPGERPGDSHRHHRAVAPPPPAREVRHHVAGGGRGHRGLRHLPRAVQLRWPTASGSRTRPTC